MSSIPGPMWLIIGIAIAVMSKLGPMKEEPIFKFFFYVGILFFVIGLIKIIIPKEKKKKDENININNQTVNGFNPFKSPEEQGINVDGTPYNKNNPHNLPQNNQQRQRTNQNYNQNNQNNQRYQQQTQQQSQSHNNITYCPMCNTRNLSKSKFCHMCGARL